MASQKKSGPLDSGKLWSAVVASSASQKALQAAIDAGDVVLPIPSTMPPDIDMYLDLYFNGSQNVKKITSELRMSLSEWKSMVPARFNLDKLKTIWNAFYEEHGEAVLNWPMRPAPVEHFVYKLDPLDWNADVWTQFTNLRDAADQSRRYLALNIKLSNDGFVYDTAQNFSTLSSDSHFHHKSAEWFALNVPTYRDHFLPLIEFAKKWMPAGDKSGKFSYNYELRRVDVLFWYHLPASAQPKTGNPNRHLLISFEPGYPETPLHQFATEETLD